MIIELPENGLRPIIQGSAEHDEDPRWEWCLSSLLVMLRAIRIARERVKSLPRPAWHLGTISRLGPPAARRSWVIRPGKALPHGRLGPRERS